MNVKAAEKPHTTAREWEASRPRFWDTYVQHRSVLWITAFVKSASGKYRLSDSGPINVLRDTGLALPYLPDPLESVEYDLSRHGLMFSTFDPESDEWQRGLRSLYFLRLQSFQETQAPLLNKIKVPGLTGSVMAPKFAPSGPVAAFIAANSAEELAYRTICLIRLDQLSMIMQVQAFADREFKSTWEVFPDSLHWANDRKSLYVTGNEKAYTKVFKIQIDTANFRNHKVVPTALSVTGSVTSVHSLSTGESDSRLLVNSSSFVDPNTISIVTPASNTSTLSSTQVISSASRSGSLYGISSSQVSSIHVPGGPDGKTPVQCWIVKPSTYNSASKRYPLFLLIHGGPELAMKDSWTTRWNALFFAEQGYIVAVPNFTGSDSFGRDFVKGVDRQWGGHPYHDIERCFNWIEKNEPRCDISRAVAAGASYGGYMANWIAGQPLGKRFKAIVSHDGILDMTQALLGADLVEADMLVTLSGSKLWEGSKQDPENEKGKEDWRRWSPVEYIHNWSTPMLFIHSDKDFRCQITDAWAGYNICKLKGIETRMLNYPDESHYVLGRENSLKWHKAVMGWCNHFAGIEDGIKLEPVASEPPWLGHTKAGRIVDALIGRA